MAIALDDLLRKIRNVTKDFEHEQQSSGVIVAFDVALAGEVITVQPKTDLYGVWASGGPVTLNTPYIVGEPGPETYFVPSKITSDDLPVLPDGDPLNITIHTSNVNPEDVAKAITESVKRAKR